LKNKYPKTNYAFIDSQNVNLSIREQGWKLDFKKFRIYLKDKFNIEKAYLFTGFIPKYQKMYNFLTKAGFTIIFKDIIEHLEGKDRVVKGNCDAELVLQVMIDIQIYDRAIIATNDGDFSCLVKYLISQNKLLYVLSPSREKCSFLLRKAARKKIIYMDDMRKLLSRP